MSRLRSAKVFRLLVLVVATFCGAAALTLVGGLPGILYAAGIALLAVVLLMRRRRDPAAADGAAPASGAADGAAPVSHRWVRKSRRIADLQAELATAGAEADELERRASALQRQLDEEQTAARKTRAILQARNDELESRLQQALDALSDERLHIDRLVGRLKGDLARHGAELTTIEESLDQLVGIAD